MNRTRHTLLWLAVLFLFSVPAISPLLSVTPIRSADGLLHIYRFVQLATLWREGIFFSRWLPDVAYGYGMPVFNYYAPLVYYIATPLHFLSIPFTLTLNFALAAALFTGAVGMFFFVRALFRALEQDSPAAGVAALVSAVAFLYAPYILFDALQRGNLAEQWALAFAPFALWRFLMLSREPGARNWAIAALSAAAVLLSHNVTGFLFAPLLFFFILVCHLTYSTISPNRNGARERPHLLRFALIIPLSSYFAALALAAFFWLPALAEREYVQIARVIVTPDFDYRFNFVPLVDLAALLPRADTGRLNPTFPATLGIVQVLFAIVGTVVLFTMYRARRALPLFYLAAAALFFSALMLSVSQPLWDNVSLLAFVQLPMRLRGLAALCLAPLVGLPLLALGMRRFRGRNMLVLGASATLAALVLTALPILYPRYARDVPLNPTLDDMFAYEQRTGTIGTTSFGEYLPAAVQEPPDKSPFEEAYARGEIPNRFVIPEGVTTCGGRIELTMQSVCASGREPWHVVYRAFYFPGWTVRVQGNVVPIAPTPRTGLIAFDVAGGDMISVQYTGTPVEHAAEVVSLATGIVILCVVGFAVLERVRKRTNKPDALPSNSGLAIQSPAPPLALFLVALVLIALKALYADRISNPFVAHFNGNRVEELQAPLNTTFNGEIELLGFDGSRTEMRRGETARIALYWRTLPGLQRDLSTFVHLTAPDGFLLAQDDNLHPANLPTTRWENDAYAVDTHTFEIPASLAPGVYQVRAGVYDPTSGVRLKNADGSDYILLASVHVRE